MKVETTYDIIIAGGGLAGLSLAWHLAKGGYSGKVLIVDETFAPNNDKTWCFWTNDKPPFAEVICKKWKKTWISVLDFKSFQYLSEYTYYCIRSGDFKEYVLTELRNHSNFNLLEDHILSITSNQHEAVLEIESGNKYFADHIFQSALKHPDLIDSAAKYPLKQHFLGWEIKTREPAFDPGTFTMMDFDEEFRPGIGFQYMLPFTQHRILLEFTVFSKSTLKKEVYEQKLQRYLYYQFGLDEDDYEIERTEYGVIPMEDHGYNPFYDDLIFNLGAIAGQTKPSTGYTFTRIQKFTKSLSGQIINGEKPKPLKQSRFRYRYYDLLLLHILSTSTEESLEVFKYLFKNNKLDEIFRFLSEETTLKQDLKIMSSVPYAPFLKAIWKNLPI